MPTEAPDYTLLSPKVQYLSDPAILIQAWKKAHAYIRSHNWYADSLELDLSALRLHELIGEWSQLLLPEHIGDFIPDKMRLVPAPKSCQWKIVDGWQPTDERELKLRPLAHISIRDQTLAMAALICLADIIETAQGDPTTQVNVKNRSSVVSYGHRLVAKWKDGKASFRWGNAKLYRQYFEDYHQFVHRPEKIRQELFPNGGSWAIVQSDLTQFYDVIPRDALVAHLQQLATKASGDSHSEPSFYYALKRLFDWKWHEKDVKIASEQCMSIPSTGLPQGLAASGLFANAYMLGFDAKVVSLFGKRPKGFKWRVLDYCRYVDDMRIRSRS